MPTADTRPLAGHATLLATYSALAGCATWWLRGRRVEVARISLADLVAVGLATEHLSRLITKDSVTAPLRAPFTEFVEAAGEGEVNERPIGGTLRHAIGELVTCPFCIAQWVATALILGRLAFPRFTAAVVNVCAVARVSDYLQLAYARAKQQ